MTSYGIPIGLLVELQTALLSANQIYAMCDKNKALRMIELRESTQLLIQWLYEEMKDAQGCSIPAKVIDGLVDKIVFIHGELSDLEQGSIDNILHVSMDSCVQLLEVLESYQNSFVTSLSYFGLDKKTRVLGQLEELVS